jgi:hypothetical protein
VRAWPRVSMGLAFVSLLFGSCAMLLVAPAEATTASYTNTVTCSASVQSGICVSTVSADYETSTISLSMTVNKATDPTSDPNWLTAGFDTDVSWAIATTDATTPAYIATANSNVNTPGTFSGIVSSATSPTPALCNSSSGVVVSFDLTANSYGLSFPSSCISSPSSLAVQATVSYATAAGSGAEVGAAPGIPQAFTSCCTVTAGASSTSPTTSATSTPTSSTTTTTTALSATTTSALTTTSSTVAAVVSSPASTGNTGSNSSGLASTGPGSDTPLLLGLGACLLAVGTLGRRRFARPTRPRHPETRHGSG